MSLPASLLSAEGLTELLRRGGLDGLARATPDRVRHKPGSGTLIGLRLEHRDGEVVPAYLRDHPDGRAAALAGAWSRRRPVETVFGDGVRLLPGGRTALFVFPNDHRLRGLRFVTDPSKLKRTLAGLEAVGGRGLRVRGRHSAFELVRYKPERRLILSAALTLAPEGTERAGRSELRAYLRFFPDARGARILRTARRLRGAGFDRLPRPMGALVEGRLFVEEAVAGTEILAAIGSGTADPDALAEMLARLHATRVDLGPTADPSWPVDRARQGLGGLAAAHPTLSSLVGEVLDALTGSAPHGGPRGPVHGDLHLHQVLGGLDGPVLVDLERAGTGHPFRDLGDLEAHLVDLADREPSSTEALMGFRDRHRAAYLRVASLDPDDLPFFLGCSLAERALLPFRGLEPGWPDRAERLLVLARSALITRARSRAGTNGSSGRLRWEVLHPSRRHRWPGTAVDGAGRTVPGRFDPETGRFEEVGAADDPHLPQLRSWLDRGRPVSYRAGRRAVVRIEAEGRTAFVKVMPPKQARSALRMARAAAALPANGALAFAEVLEANPDEGVLILGALAGRTLKGVLADPRADHHAAVAVVARGLAAFHALQPPEETPSTPPRDLEAWTDLVARLDRDRAAALRTTLRHLRAAGIPLAATPGTSLVHGDLHDGNLLVDGDRLGVADLDSLRLGHPADDLGNLCAHLVLRALQHGRPISLALAQAAALLDRYRKAGARVEPEAERAARAAALYRLACVYTFRRRWRGLTTPLLTEAGRAAAGL